MFYTPLPQIIKETIGKYRQAIKDNAYELFILVSVAFMILMSVFLYYRTGRRIDALNQDIDARLRPFENVQRK